MQISVVFKMSTFFTQIYEVLRNVVPTSFVLFPTDTSFLEKVCAHCFLKRPHSSISFILLILSHFSAVYAHSSPLKVYPLFREHSQFHSFWEEVNPDILGPGMHRIWCKAGVSLRKNNSKL